ncbi:MAG: hypothetical protein ASARMPREDX12_005615 [Alectoria sarmentosa]|nr:MAG: hypothetical protein ASARMPREDX12_005615 [Alectoria sarmentosa]
MAAATTTSNPLNNFIGAANAAASVVKSANSAESSPTSSSSSTAVSPSTTATSAPAATSASHVAAAAHHGLSEGAKIGIIVGCVVGAVVLLALLGLCCCCLLRRRRRSKRHTTATPVQDEEVKSWKSPINPGRHYSNYSPAQNGQAPTEQSPTVPLMAAAAAEHHVHDEKAPSLSQHPAMRHQENPFVPEPPSPRRTAPNSRAGLTDGMVPGAAAYVVLEKQRLRKSSSRSRSNSDTRPQSSGLPTHNDANRPATPFGLTGFGEPAGHTIHSGASPPYSGIGQPYEDQHVQNLRVDAPSRELQHSMQNRQVISGAAFSDDNHPKYRNSRGYTTPPEVPSHSPNRDNRASMLADSSYDSELSTTTASNSSGERYQGQIDPYRPAQRETIAPWEQHQKRFSNSPQSSPRVAAPPPIPWEESEFNINARKHQSHSPRQSGQYTSGDGRRRSSRSPATSINGQPRRLRFEDLQADNRASGAYTGVGQHDSYDGYNNNNSRWSQGVGEAL